MADSDVEFIITITKQTGTYSNGSTTLVPLGHPILKRSWNGTDECTFFLQDIDSNGESALLDEVTRNDIITLDRDSLRIFRGDVITKMYVHTGGIHQIKIKARDKLYEGNTTQLNRILLNRSVQHYVPVKETAGVYTIDIPPDSADRLRRVEVLNPYGVWKMEASSAIDNTQAVIYNDGIADNWKLAGIFKNKPRSTPLFWPFTLEEALQGRLVKGIWLSLWDSDRHTTHQNPFPVEEDVTVTLTTVNYNTTTGVYRPSGALNKRISGDPAAYTIPNNRRETWQGISAADFAFSVPGADLTWVGRRIVGTGFLRGTEDVTIKNMGWADGSFDRYVEIQCGTGDTQEMETTDFETRGPGDVAARCQWIEFQLQMSTTSNSAQIFVSGYDPDFSISAEVLEWELDSGDIYYYAGEAGENGTRVDTTIDYTASSTNNTTDMFYLYANCNFDSHTMDLYHKTHLGSDMTLIAENIDMMNRDAFITRPDRVGSVRMRHTGTGSLFVGFVNANAAPSFGMRYLLPGGKLIYLDLSDDPVPIAFQTRIGIEVEIAVSGHATQESMHLWRDSIGVYGNNETRDFVHVMDPGTGTYVKQTGGLDNVGWAMMLEYDEAWETIIPRSVGNGVITIEPTETALDYITVVGVRANEAFETFKNARVIFFVNQSSRKYGILVQDVHIEDASQPYTAHRNTVADIVKKLCSFVENWAVGEDVTVRELPATVGDDTIGSGWHDDTDFFVDFFVVKQKSVVEALRELADQYGAVFYLSLDGTNALTFEGIKTIASATNSPSSANPEPHEYVFVADFDAFGDDEAYRLMANTVGRDETEVYTDYIVKGSPEIQSAHYINYPLAEALGTTDNPVHIFRDPEVFPQETDEKRLWDLASSLNDIFGKESFGGDITVSGYNPIFTDNRLDINGIVRIIDSESENGSDTIGTNNVFKIISLEYNGFRDETKVEVSNHDLNKALMLQRIEEQRRVLRGMDEENPERRINEYNLRPIDPVSPPITADPVYMALFDQGGEVTSPGYVRRITSLRTFTEDSRNFKSYRARFETGLGTTRNDQFPIETIRLYDAATAGTELVSTGTRVDHGAVTSGPFQVAETITFVGSGATGVVLAVNSLSLDFAGVIGTPESGDVLTGGISSATANWVRSNTNFPSKRPIYKWEDQTFTFTFNVEEP